MKRILVTTLLLSCMTLVGCNPVTMKITASDDLSNINVEVDGFSLENITMQEDGSVKMIRRAETPADYFATLDFTGLLKK